MNFYVNINVCRVCMKSEEGASLLEDEELRRKFMFTTRLKLEAGNSLPAIICSKCITRLKISHDFIQLAHHSERNLKAFLEKVSRDFQQVTQFGPNVSKDEDTGEDEELLSLMLEDEISVPDITKKPIIHHSDSETEEEKPQQKRNVGSSKKLETEAHSLPKIVKSIKECDNISSETFATTELAHTELNLIHYKSEEDLNEFVNIRQPTTKDAVYESSGREEHGMEQDYIDEDSQTELQILDETLQQSEDAQSTENVEQPQHSGGFLKEYQATLVEDEFLEDSDSLNEAGVAELNLYESGNDPALQHQEEPMSPEILDESEMELETIVEAQVVHPNSGAVATASVSRNTATRKLPVEIRSKTRRSQSKLTASSSKIMKKPAASPLSTRFYCFKCNRDFSTKTNLRRHMTTHEGSRPFQCDICEKSFTQNASLKQHMYTHTGEKPYVCEVCQRGFTQCKTLVFHMRRHTGEKPFPCEKCGALFRQKDGLKAHILKRHTITAHRGNTELHSCAICKEDLADKYSLQEHMKKHVNNHKSVADPSVTSSNELIDGNNSVMLLELMEDELLEEKPTAYMNQYAEDITSSAHVVDLMTTSASEPSRAKKYQCRKCFKCFAIKRNLLRHLTTHDLAATDEFPCKSCDISFSSIDELWQHRRRQHSATESELLQCVFCNLVFNSFEKLNEHNNFQHLFRCRECPSAHFATRQLLTEHIMEHELNDIE